MLVATLDSSFFLHCKFRSGRWVHMVLDLRCTKTWPGWGLANLPPPSTPPPPRNLKGGPRSRWIGGWRRLSKRLGAGCCCFAIEPGTWRQGDSA